MIERRIEESQRREEKKLALGEREICTRTGPAAIAPEDSRDLVVGQSETG